MEAISDEKLIKREYMRNYMNAYYKSHKDGENKKCLARYYKKKLSIPQEDIDNYGEHIVLVLKTKKCIEQMKKDCPHFLESVLL